MFALCNSIFIRNYTCVIVGAILSVNYAYLFRTKIQFCTASQRTVIADELLDRIVTWVLVLCKVGGWLGCIGVVPTTVRESATTDFKENKQADVGNRLF